MVDWSDVKELWKYANREMNNDRLIEFYKKVREIAVYRGVDVVGFIDEVGEYLLSTTHVGREYLLANRRIIRHNGNLNFEVICGLLHNLYLWLYYYYPLHGFINSERGRRVMQELADAKKWATERFGVRIRDKWVKTSTAGGKKITIGLKGLMSDAHRGDYAEYPKVAKYVMRADRTKNGKKMAHIILDKEDRYLVPWFLVAHEIAHAVCGVKEKHGDAFKEAYRKVLKDMADERENLRKYIKE